MNRIAIDDSYTVELRNSTLEITPGPLAADAPQGGGDTKALATLIAYLDRTPLGFGMHTR